MKIEEIRANAPEGATHYIINRYTSITYLKIGRNFYKNYFGCKAYVEHKGWCGDLTIREDWFFGTRYKVFFDDHPYVKANAYPL